VTVLRYQLGDWKPYIYRTENYGRSWTLITEGIPSDYPVRVLREDPVREGLLFAGTEFGVFMSLDDGENWMKLQNNLPVTPITDMKIHRDDLVLSTMGRSFWILDNITPLRTYGNFSQQALLKINDTHRYRYRSYSDEHLSYPSSAVDFDYFISKENVEKVTISIYGDDDNLINSYSSGLEQEEVDEYEMSSSTFVSLKSNKVSTGKGLNRFSWDMRHRGSWDENVNRSFRSGPMVSPGEYVILLDIDGVKNSKSFKILEDPRVEGMSGDDYLEQEKFLLNVRDFLTDLKVFKSNLDEKMKSSNSDIYSEVYNLLVTSKGTYMQPMLIDQTRYLQSMLGRADQVPGKDAYERLRELKESFSKLKDSLGD
jgi:hypothetical protein